MKNALFVALFACLLSVSVLPVRGQEGVPPQEPDFAGVFMLLDSATGKLTPLERQQMQIETARSIISGTKLSQTVKGEKSTVRLKAGQPIDLVVKVPPQGQGMDPVAMFQLMTFESKKGRREVAMVQVKKGIITDRASTGVGESLPFEANKHGASSVRLAVGQGLAPGEYLVRTTANLAVFCFGVDGATGQ